MVNADEMNKSVSTLLLTSKPVLSTVGALQSVFGVACD